MNNLKKYLILFFVAFLWFNPGIAQQLIFKTQPSDADACVSSSASFMVETDTLGFNNEIIIYEWQLKKEGENWNTIQEGTDNTLIIEDLTAAFNNSMIKCKAKIETYEKVSDTALLSVFHNPEISFIYSDTCWGSITKFLNTSATIDNMEWQWDFSDGSLDSSVFESPNHYYENPGLYNVTLIGTNNNGCSGMMSREINILSLPEPIIYGTDSVACSFQKNIKFYTQDTTFINYMWEINSEDDFCYFNNQQTENPEIYIDCYSTEDPVQFNIKLEAEDQYGCVNHTQRAFLLMDYQSPNNAAVVQKPENSRMLICLIENPDNYKYKWFKTTGINYADTAVVSKSEKNFLLFEEQIDTVQYQYGVTITDTNQNYCFSSFYFNKKSNTQIGKSISYTKNGNIVSIESLTEFRLEIYNSNGTKILEDKSFKGSLIQSLDNFTADKYALKVYRNNQIVLSKSIIVK